MTIQEAKEVFGFRPNDTIVKSGLEAFRRSYKKVLKDTSLSRDMQKIYKINLEAVETLLGGADDKDETAPAPKKVAEVKTEPKESSDGFLSLFV